MVGSDESLIFSATLGDCHLMAITWSRIVVVRSQMIVRFERSLAHSAIFTIVRFCNRQKRDEIEGRFAEVCVTGFSGDMLCRNDHNRPCSENYFQQKQFLSFRNMANCE